MARERFRRGDVVEIVTVDRGMTSTKQPLTPIREERWRAIIIGPSVFVPGWWVVKKIPGNRITGCTVPDDEIECVVRRT
jgi:hypothetical protein